jgi:hypothetical protein
MPVAILRDGASRLLRMRSELITRPSIAEGLMVRSAAKLRVSNHGGKTDPA